MTLLEIRTQAAKVSGRYDLVNPTTFADNGMNFYINMGQKFLDSLVDTPHMSQEVTVTLAAGAYAVSLPNFRAIEGVIRRLASSGVEYELEKVLYQDLRAAVGGAGGLGAVERSAPTVYALVPVRSASPTVATESYRGIWVGPPADVEYQLIVQGLTWSPELSSNDHVSYWSAAHPELLVLATLHSLEVMYRNTQGANDYEVQIRNRVDALDKDAVSEMIAAVDLINDSW